MLERIDAMSPFDFGHAALLVGVGLTAGFLSGLIGMGGALLLVPALAFIAGMPFKLATGTASLHGLAVGLSGYLIHGRYGTVDVRAGVWAGGGSVAGGLLGAAISGYLDSTGVQLVYLGAAGLSLVLLLVPVRSAAIGRRERVPHPEAKSVMIGAVTGVVAGNIGAGGNFMLIPLSRWALRMPIHVAIGTSMLISIFTAVAATSGKALLGQVPWFDAILVVTGSALGTLAGARLTRKIPSAVLRGLLIVILILLLVRTSAEMLIG
jgi:uncharacterized membrane protein YfcA